MAVTVFGLGSAQLTGWKVDEEAVSRDRDLSSGAVTQLALQGAGGLNPLGKRGTQIKLLSDEYGLCTGKVVSASLSPEGWAVEANAAMHALAVDAPVAPAFEQPMAQVYAHYCSAAAGKASLSKVRVTGSLATEKFNVPASSGSVWQAFKRFLSANEIDIYWLDETAVFTRMKDAALGELRDVATQWNISEKDHEEASSISCYVYHREKTNSTFFAGWDVVYPPRKTFYPTATKHKVDPGQELPILTVGANEEAEHTLQLDTELRRVSQPGPRDSINNTQAPMAQGAAGIYAVTGSDNRPITRGMWEAFGGSLHVKLDKDDPSRVIVSIKGPNLPWLAPFRIAESDGEKDYSALYIVGEGDRVDIEEVTLNTASTSNGDPVVIDNPAIDTVDKAYKAMQYAADLYGGTETELSWSGRDPARTYMNDDVIVSGTSVDERRKMRQTFGRLAGRRFRGHDRIWRCKSAGISESGVDMTLEPDDTLADLDLLWGLPRVAEPKMKSRTLGALSGERLNAI